ncbi:MAG: C40 family peptidase [Brachymonas sp.]|nr:C40 family peptidase [Brachymonas sp.]
MNISDFSEDNRANLQALPRRQFLQGLGLAVAGSSMLALAGCGAPPRKAASAGRVRSGGVRQGSVAGNSRPVPEVAVRQPVQLDPWLREEAVARAMLALNAPYRYGGSTLDTGFDCSGLVQYVFSSFAGRALPRSAVQWAQASRPIGAEMLQRGDLVFFNTSGASFSHMGIYIGERQFVHAPSSGKVVSTANLGMSYYQMRFDGARTVFSA